MKIHTKQYPSKFHKKRQNYPAGKHISIALRIYLPRQKDIPAQARLVI